MSVNAHANGTTAAQLEEHDSATHQACYLFKPAIDPYQNAQHPKKKRKIAKTPSSTIKTTQTPFSALLDGVERSQNVQFRHATFQELWSKQQSQIDEIIGRVNSNTLEEVADFVRVAPELYSEKLLSGLIVAGPNIAGHGRLFEQLAERLRAETNGPVVILHSGEASNLKTVLKQLIKGATSQQDVNEDLILPDQREGLKLLNYDLQILFEHVQTHHNQTVVVGFQDSEAFDGNLLSDLISLFHAWRDRIPFILLFGIATSVELFQEKLPKSTIRCLQGTKFDVARVEESLESVFTATTGETGCGPLWLGPGLSRVLLERQKDHVQSVQAFCMALKYAYMAHVYANPLSILLAHDIDHASLQPEHFEAIRTLPSFRRFSEEWLAKGHVEMVRDLLADDSSLWKTVLEQFKEGQTTMETLIRTLEHVETIHLCTHSNTCLTRSDLYVRAMAGELASSALIRDVLLSIKKMTSDSLDDLLRSISSIADMELSDLHNQLRKLLNTLSSNGRPLRSEHDVRHQTLRTTVVAQKVELSKQKSSLSKDDATYSKIVNSVHDVLQSYFTRTLINPQHLFLYEVFIYDLKSPHRDVFTAKPRFAVERALSTPHDYLGCECCKALGEGLSPSQPPTAILYQLYLESGALINIFDLWSAFHAIVGQESDNDEDQQKALTIFYRALADLKYMGLFKHSRKKTDHLAKLVWKGL